LTRKKKEKNREGTVEILPVPTINQSTHTQTTQMRPIKGHQFPGRKTKTTKNTGTLVPYPLPSLCKEIVVVVIIMPV